MCRCREIPIHAALLACWLLQKPRAVKGDLWPCNIPEKRWKPQIYIKCYNNFHSHRAWLWIHLKAKSNWFLQNLNLKKKRKVRPCRLTRGARPQFQNNPVCACGCDIFTVNGNGIYYCHVSTHLLYLGSLSSLLIIAACKHLSKVYNSGILLICLKTN